MHIDQVPWYTSTYGATQQCPILAGWSICALQPLPFDLSSEPSYFIARSAAASVSLDALSLIANFYHSPAPRLVLIAASCTWKPQGLHCVASHRPKLN